MSALAPLSKLESSVTLTRQRVRHVLAEAEHKSRAQVHALGGQVIELGKWLQLVARPVVIEVRDAELESAATDLRGEREAIEGVDLLAFAASAPASEVVVEAPSEASEAAPVVSEAAVPEIADLASAAPESATPESATPEREDAAREDAVSVAIPVASSAGPRPKKAHKKSRKHRR